MDYHLVVIQDFGNYKKGQQIQAADEVAMILAGPQHPHVVKINAPEREKVDHVVSHSTQLPPPTL